MSPRHTLLYHAFIALTFIWLTACDSDKPALGTSDETLIERAEKIATIDTSIVMQKPTITEANAESYARMAVLLRPNLPIELQEMLANTAELNSYFSRQNRLKTTLEKPLNTQPLESWPITSCLVSGELKETLSDVFIDGDGNSTITKDFTFNQCANQQEDYIQTINGNMVATITTEITTATITTDDGTIENIDASFDFNRLSVIHEDHQSSHQLDGQFGWSQIRKPENNALTTMFGGTGLNTFIKEGKTEIIAFDDFATVIDSKPNQKVEYIYGNVGYVQDRINYDYTVSTIIPVGRVYDEYQGKLLIEHKSSLLFITFLTANTLFIELDSNSDSVIDYSAEISLQ